LLMKHFLLKLTICLLFQVFVGSMFAQKTGNSGFSQATVTALQNEIIKMGGEDKLAHASIGFCVFAHDSNTIVASYNPELALVPASTMKILTTAAAMGILGNFHKFTTSLEYSGSINAQTGVLEGNIYIKGGGDPTLGNPRLDRHYTKLLSDWVAEIRALGIKAIRGSIIADADIYDDQLTPPTWIWGDMGNYFGAGASGLSINENQFIATFNPGKAVGDPVVLETTEPDMSAYTIVNYITTGSSGIGDKSWFAAAPFGGEISMYGELPLGKANFKVRGAIPDPALTTARLLYDSLREAGIAVRGEATTTRKLRLSNGFRKEERKEIRTYNSKPLGQIAFQTNRFSLNIYAEALLRAIGLKQTGSGSYDKGTAALLAYFLERGVDMKGCKIFDGSGLSRFNTLTALQLCKILSAISEEIYYTVFYESLPVAGRSGTLSSLGKGTFAEGRIIAKSGFMTGVRAYAGYAKTRSGREVSFAIIVNNFDCTPRQMRSMIEKVMVKICELS